MKSPRSLLIAGAVVAALLSPQVARADETKRNLYVLGVHLGNADGVLFGLMNSTPPDEKSHPGAFPLLHRQLRWSIDLAKVLGSPTAAMEKLDKELDGLTFVAMAPRVRGIIEEQQAYFAAKINPQAAATFILGAHLTMADHIARHVRDYRRDQKPGSGGLVLRNAGWLKQNILDAKLEAKLSLADELLKKIAAGESFAALDDFMANTMLEQWQKDFLAAPGFGGGAGGGARAVAVGSGMRFGITATGGKRLTFSANGSTNTTVMRIDGKPLELGGAGGKITEANTKLPGGGTRSVWISGDIRVTQLLEPSGDAVLVRWLLENTGGRQHTAGLRLQLDTLIGSNDGVPFAVPGQPGLVTTSADFKGGQAPEFVQALEKPDVNNPGTVARLSLRLGGKIEAPGRVSLTRWPGGSLAWEIPVANMGSDSAAVLYWDERPLAPGHVREIGFAYGIGAVTGNKGHLGATVSGRPEAGKEFFVTAYINNPVAGETVTLDAPAGANVVGPATVSVPQPNGGNRTALVTWRVRAERAGMFRLTIRSSTGATLEQGVNVGAAATQPGSGRP